MTPEQDERFVIALEGAVGALASIAKTLELDYARKYPPRKEVKDADVYYVKSDEELLKEAQGQTRERTTEEWTSLGPRERKFLDEKEASNASGKTTEAGRNHTRKT